MLETNNPKHSISCVREQVHSDMYKYLQGFKDIKYGKRRLASESDIHSKTINRLFNKENTPGHITILKLYRVLLGESSTSRLIPLLPKTIKEVLLKDGVDLCDDEVDYSGLIKNELLNDSIFCEIYFLVDAGKVTRDLIMFKFGEHGLHILEKMISLRAIKYVDEDFTIEIDTRIQLDGQIIKNAGLTLSKKYSEAVNTEIKGENFIALYVESLPEEAYQEWLRIDKEAFIKKAEIAKQHRSTQKGRKVFTYMTTDTFSKS